MSSAFKLLREYVKREVAIQAVLDVVKASYLLDKRSRVKRQDLHELGSAALGESLNVYTIQIIKVALGRLGVRPTASRGHRHYSGIRLRDDATLHVCCACRCHNLV